MVVIPAGSFMMGSPDGENGHDQSEGPQHKETIPRAFAMSKTVVTFAQYKKFMNDTGRDAGASCWYYRTDKNKWLPKEGLTFTDPGYQQQPDSPAVCLNIGDATAYAAWLSKQTGKNYRLPSEAEWEAAAIGEAAGDRLSDNRRRWPWGDARPSPANANLDFAFDGPVDVACFPAGDSAFGCRQMIGNTWEWTASTFEPFPGFNAGPYKEYSAPWFGDHKVLRGGSFATRPSVIRNTWRNFYTPDRRDVYAGFRTSA